MRDVSVLMLAQPSGVVHHQEALRADSYNDSDSGSVSGSGSESGDVSGLSDLSWSGGSGSEVDNGSESGWISE